MCDNIFESEKNNCLIAPIGNSGNKILTIFLLAGKTAMLDRL